MRSGQARMRAYKRIATQVNIPGLPQGEGAGPDHRAALRAGGRARGGAERGCRRRMTRRSIEQGIAPLGSPELKIDQDPGDG